MTIKNLNVKKGKVVIGNYSEIEILTVTSVSEVAGLSPEQKVAIKKLIISGTNYSDLTGIGTIGADNGELPNLVSIELQNITAVSVNLFYGGSNNNWLKSFSAPEATNIRNGAFYNCVALTEINLPEAESIEASVFRNCYALTEINLPEAEFIGSSAFYNCVALRKLTLGGTSVTVDTNPFDNLTTNQVDLYLSEEEMQNVNGNQWTKDGTTWTFKSIQQIVP